MSKNLDTKLRFNAANAEAAELGYRIEVSSCRTTGRGCTALTLIRSVDPRRAPAAAALLAHETPH